MRRRDGDEAAVAVLAQCGPRVLGEQERTGEEQRHEPVPLVLREVGDGSDVLEAGVGDEGVDPAEALERSVDDEAITRARSQVRVREVDAVHRPAVRLEPLDDRAADPAGRAGDQRNLHARCGPQRRTLAAQV